MKVIEDYGRAVENADERGLQQAFAPQVRVEVPAGPAVTHSGNTAAHILGQVAHTAPGIRRTLTADAGNSWYLLGFEGRLEGEKLSLIHI